MYASLHAVLSPRVADAVYVVLMAMILLATLLLAAHPEASLRYARL